MSKASSLLFLARHWNAVMPALKYAFHEVRRSDLCLLANLYGSDKGLGAHGYTRIYEHLFCDRREAVTGMLEIGLLRKAMHTEAGANAFTDAPSLKMWCAYFPNAQVIGFDIQDFSGFSHPRCCVVRGDQSSRQDLAQVNDRLNGDELDIIIDDGSHVAHDQQISLAVLFPRLKSGGFYCIEDLNYRSHASDKRSSSRTVDVLTSYTGSGGMKSPYLSAEENAMLAAQIGTIGLYDSLMSRHAAQTSLAIIEKK